MAAIAAATPRVLEIDDNTQASSCPWVCVSTKHIVYAIARVRNGDAAGKKHIAIVFDEKIVREMRIGNTRHHVAIKVCTGHLTELDRAV